MYFDIELINKVCSLSCKEEDVNRDQTLIRYDKEYPFHKYYSLETIVSAIQNYINHEWNDVLLSGWACIYGWILAGGFADDLKENFGSVEKFIVNEILWALDGLSFFDDSMYDEDPRVLNDWIEDFKSLDKVLKTASDWKGIFATIGEYSQINNDQYVLLQNDDTKQYIIIHTDYFDNGNNYEGLQYCVKDEYMQKVKELISLGYSLIHYDEELLYIEYAN